MEHQEGAVEFDLGHLGVGHGGGEDGASVGLLADIADEALDDFAVDAAVFDFGEIDSPGLFELTDKAYVVSIILTTWSQVNFFLKTKE